MRFRAGYIVNRPNDTEKHLEDMLLTLQQESGPMNPFHDLLELTVHAIREARDGRPALLDQPTNVRRCT